MEADLHRVFAAVQLGGHARSVHARWYREAIGEHELGWVWSLLCCYGEHELGLWVAQEFPLVTRDEGSSKARAPVGDDRCSNERVPIGDYGSVREVSGREELLYRLVVRREMERACLLVHELRQADPWRWMAIGECLLEYPPRALLPSKEAAWQLDCRARLRTATAGEGWHGRLVAWLRDRELHIENLPWHDRLVAQGGKLPPETPHAEIIAAKGDPASLLTSSSLLPLWFKVHYAALHGLSLRGLKEYALREVSSPFIALDYLTYLAEGGQDLFLCKAREVYHRLSPLQRKRLRGMAHNFGLQSLLVWMHGQEAKLLAETCPRSALRHATLAADPDLQRQLTTAAMVKAVQADNPLEVLKKLISDEDEDNHSSESVFLLYKQVLREADNEEPLRQLILHGGQVPVALRVSLANMAKVFLLAGQFRDSQIMTILLGWLDELELNDLALRRLIQAESVRLLTS